ncbi:MAG: tripartite tricarboxylate transporter substrate-binding protein, partial [Burkholderiales bacterium]
MKDKVRAAFALALGAALPALAQEGYPTKPVRLVVPASGGGSDLVARLLAPRLTEALGQQVIVDNRGGAHVPANTVAKAAPDGYTILVQNNTIWIAPLLEKTAYDHVSELAPMTLTGRAPNVLVVHPSFPVGSVRDLIAAAKAAPGTINYASGVAGSSNHVAAEL